MIDKKLEIFSHPRFSLREGLGVTLDKTRASPVMITVVECHGDEFRREMVTSGVLLDRDQVLVLIKWLRAVVDEI